MKSWDNLIADIEMPLTGNFTFGRADRIQHVVVHHNGGQLTVQGCWNTWQTRPASAHYQVQVDGVIGQLVNDWDTAWHANDAAENARSIGIEHANSYGTSGPLSEATLDNGAHLVAALCKKYDLGRPAWGVNVFGHSAFSQTECPGHIAGDQNSAYMVRAQAYYDGTTEGDDMPTAQEIADAVWGKVIPNPLTNKGNYSAGDVLNGTNYAAWQVATANVAKAAVEALPAGQTVDVDALARAIVVELGKKA